MNVSPNWNAERVPDHRGRAMRSCVRFSAPSVPRRDSVRALFVPETERVLVPLTSPSKENQP